jgi:nicotinamide riboside transporter PnuC
MMWFVTVASLIGTIANIYKRRWCFIIWFFTNVSWTIYDIYIHAYAQATLMGIYAALAVHGWIKWGKL